MTMLPTIKVCSKCKKSYSWNPDVGSFNCPYCHGLGSVGKESKETGFDKLKNKKNR